VTTNDGAVRTPRGPSRFDVVSEEEERQSCSWRVTSADGTVLGEGSFSESDYQRAVSRAKAAAASCGPKGALLTLVVDRMSILTLRL
jgi:hypothetical protein